MTDSRDKILAGARRAAQKIGYQAVRRRHVAEAAGCSPALVSFYFGTMDNLRKEMMRDAVTRGDTAVVAQGLAAGDRIARRAPAELKQKATLKLTTA